MLTTDGTPASELSRFFSRHHVPPDCHIVAAFSGGADSLALLILLRAIVGAEHIVAVHVDHGLRPEEELDAERKLNEDNCASLGIALRIVKLGRSAVATCAAKRGNGIEEAARVLRYEALERVRAELGFPYIATAHTADDQAETVLMRLFQGSGPLSLQGIAPMNGKLIRPMLSLTRAVVEQVVHACNLSWSEDSTNADLRFLRNKIRHTVVPEIARVHPGYREALISIADRAAASAHAIEGLVDRVYAEAVIEEKDGLSIDTRVLRMLPEVVSEQVLYRCWSLVGGSGGSRLPQSGVRRLLTLFRTSGGTEAIVIGPTLATVKDDRLRWKRRGESLAAGYVSLVYSSRTPLEGSRVLIIGGEPESPLPVAMRARIPDAARVGRMVVRSATGGDRIELAEGTKKVSSLFASWHVDSQVRWQIPVIEDEAGILAVLGGAYGGKDRVARRCLVPTLARNDATLYSVTDTEGMDCG